MLTMRCNTYTPFTRAPLTCESYIHRLRTHRCSVHWDLDLIDCIRAGRRLQRTQRPPRSTAKALISSESLGLAAPAPAQIEAMLYKYLNDNDFESLDTAVKEFVTYRPRPRDFGHILGAVKCNFGRSLTQSWTWGSSSRARSAVVHTALNVLLDGKDYFNGFVLIDATFASKAYLDYKRRQLINNCILASAVTGAVTVAQWSLMPLVPLAVWGIASTVFVGTTLAGLWRATLVDSVGRLTWRHYNSLYYNTLHQDELIAVSKIIRHFEEHNEVNIRNFHHSEVREESSLDMFDQNEYILEAPVSRPTVMDLEPHFKRQLNQRRMVLNDVSDELMFLEFWLTHGENFAWVEPDQDPAEIQKLKIVSKEVH